GCSRSGSRSSRCRTATRSCCARPPTRSPATASRSLRADYDPERVPPEPPVPPGPRGPPPDPEPDPGPGPDPEPVPPVPPRQFGSGVYAGPRTGTCTAWVSGLAATVTGWQNTASVSLRSLA